MTSVAVTDIRALDRCRRDLGDLGPLAESIAAVGLLHPVVVTEDLRLIAGARRLAACKSLGWSEVPVHVVRDITTATELLHAERDENTHRLDLSPSEKVALGMKLEKLEQPLAEQRKHDGQKRGGGDRKSLGANLAQSDPKPDRAPRTADRVGEAVGMSRTTYKRAKRIVVAAEEGDKRAQEAVAEMNQTGKVETAYRKAFDEQKRPRGGNKERLDKSLQPLDHYLKTFSDYNLRGMTPKEARARLLVVQRIEAGLFELERALVALTIVSRALQ